MKILFTFSFCLLATLSLYSQSNIQQSLSVNATGAAADASAQLDVSANNKGMLVPRMTSSERAAIVSPATGLLVFDTTTRTFWFFSGTVWINIAPHSTLADADNDTKIQVEEIPDEDIIRFDLAGTERLVLRSSRLEFKNTGRSIFIGTAAGANDDLTNNSNTAVGDSAMYINTTGSFNTALGFIALKANTSGTSNTAIGVEALLRNTSGSGNTSVGSTSLVSNTVGDDNTAVGVLALASNTNGNYNTATGVQALYNNTGGDFNSAFGVNALSENTTGNNNTAIGASALASNTTGIRNTASGVEALTNNDEGSRNVASGFRALHSNNGGSSNAAYGAEAMSSNLSGSDNTACGDLALSSLISGSNNTAVGRNAGLNNVAGSGNVFLGNSAGAQETSSNKLYIDNSNTTTPLIWGDFFNDRVGINRVATTNELEVGGTASKATAGDWLANSDARLKKNIAPLNSQEMLKRLLSLQGITYEWNDDKTGSKRPEGVQYGFTAQNIQEVFPTLVEEDKLGYLQTAYGTYDAMTVEAIRALHNEMENGKLRIENLEAENAALKAELQNYKSQLDKITAALQGAGITIEK